MMIVRRQDDVVVVEDPVVVGVRRDVGALERIRPQVEELRDPQRDERLGPDLQRALDALLHEHDLPVVEAEREHVAVVGEVDEPLPRALVHLAGEVGQQVVAVDVDLEGLVADRVARLQLLDDVGLARGGEERRQPVVVLDDLVRDRRRRGSCRASGSARHAERALPVRVLLAAERRHPAVRPDVHVRAVVGAVDDDRVLGDARARRACRAAAPTSLSWSIIVSW